MQCSIVCVSDGVFSTVNSNFVLSVYLSSSNFSGLFFKNCLFECNAEFFRECHIPFSPRRESSRLIVSHAFFGIGNIFEFLFFPLVTFTCFFVVKPEMLSAPSVFLSSTPLLLSLLGNETFHFGLLSSLNGSFPGLVISCFILTKFFKKFGMFISLVH